MKLNILIVLAWFIPTWGLAAEEIPVKSKITEVNIYRQRAMIIQEGTAKVVKGDNLLIFTGLSQSLIKNSITVSGTGSGTIQAVTHRVNYLSRTAKPPRLILLEDSLKVLSQKLKVLDDEKFVYENEQQLILTNNKIGGTDNGLTAEELQKMANLYRERLAAIRQQLREIELSARDLRQLQNDYQLEINQINVQRSQPTEEVVVTFNAKAAGTVNLTLKYLVNDASWSPFYDIRVENTRDPLKFFLKAQVVNRTGINWDQVKIRISTTNNSGNNNSPSLNPWLVGIYIPQPTMSYEVDSRRYKSDGRAGEAVMSAPAGAAMDDLDEKEEVAGYAYDMTTTTEGELGLEFEIAALYDIPADGKEHQVDILATDVKGEFRHFAIPKMDKDAFLVAYISQDLLRAKANVYFEGTFVGETFVNTDNPGDSMKISLGRDPKVQIQREQVKDFTETKVIGSNIRQTFGYDIILKNNKSEAVNLNIEDQIPVSQNKDIIVELLESSGGTLADLSGKVTWNLTLKPGETRTLNLRFEVKYPKNQPVSGL
ncbi:MAG: DUF4139 domain-containing protein [Bacteroidia bacterium]|nr:DUF4139 domain-containing protein [Bacteroidia bacterium]